MVKVVSLEGRKNWNIARAITPDVHRELERSEKMLRDWARRDYEEGRTKRVRVTRVNPCTTCEHAGLCKINGLTCKVFRRFVDMSEEKAWRELWASKPRRTPDKTWGGSFNGE